MLEARIKFLYIVTMRSSHPIAKCTFSTGLTPLLLLLLLAVMISDVASACYIRDTQETISDLPVASDAGATEEQCTKMESIGATAFWKVLSHYAVTTLHTLEVFIRGFLLGFGATLLKDLLIDGKREAADRANAVHYGKYIGLGMGCVLVGLSVLIPTRLQEWVMDSRI